MNDYIISLLERLIGKARVFRSLYATKKLLKHDSLKVNAIGQALYETLKRDISQQEQENISLIEARRSALLKSDEIIEVIDYGAGNPDDHRTEDEMRRGVRSAETISAMCRASKTPIWALCLFKLIRKLQPIHCLELGTCVGISASYQAAGLNLNDKGNLWTLEGCPAMAKIAIDTLKGLGYKNTKVMIGPFFDTYHNALASARPVDFLFNDGHHDHDALLNYFVESLPYLADEAIIVFDDISWSPGMERAWKGIENNERVPITINLRAMGIALISNRISTKQSFYIPLQ